MRKISPLRFIPLVLWIIIIYILLTLPGSDFSEVGSFLPQNFDKLVHATLFGGIVFWFGFALIHAGIETYKRQIWLITIIACLYGIGMEYVQKFWTNNTRSFSYADMCADVIGAFIAFFLVRWLAKKYPSLHEKKKQNSAR